MPAAANPLRELFAACPQQGLGLITVDRRGQRRQWSFAALTAASGSLAGHLAARGVRRGDVVLTLVGSTIDYALTMLACLRIGAAMLPCSEQLRPKDIALRLHRAAPALAVCDSRNREALDAAAPACPVLTVPDETLWTGPAPDWAELAPTDPAFVLFTSGTTGDPKLVTHGQRYVTGQRLQAHRWLAARPGEVFWSTAAPGWSKSTRNSFLAPWLCGAAALLVDRRFDPDERLATIRREGVNVLCMAPTEYRLIDAHTAIENVPSLRRIVTAGEALGVSAVRSWQEQTGLTIADGYGQTETGHIAGVLPGQSAPLGSMGRALPGVTVRIDDGELCVDPATVPTFFLGYSGDPDSDSAEGDARAGDCSAGDSPDADRPADDRPATAGWWRTGDRVTQDEQGWLYFTSRADDVIVSAGYRIGPTEVESVLLAHPAVREVGVIGVPDAVRGEVVAAVVVLRDGYAGSDELARALREHAKAETAPYKYPRQIRFADALPKTTSGKISRATLRKRW